MVSGGGEALRVWGIGKAVETPQNLAKTKRRSSETLAKILRTTRCLRRAYAVLTRSQQALGWL